MIAAQLPDLFTAARNGVRFGADETLFSLKVQPFEPYAVIGMIGEHRIHEIIDKPNAVVCCMVHRRLLAASSEAATQPGKSLICACRNITMPVQWKILKLRGG